VEWLGVLKMKITDIIRDNSVARNKGTYAEQVEREKELAAQNAALSGDKVSISPLARQFAQLSEVVSDDEAKRRVRIDELKKKFEDGTLDVSSDEVAKSIIRHAAES